LQKVAEGTINKNYMIFFLLCNFSLKEFSLNCFKQKNNSNEHKNSSNGQKIAQMNKKIVEMNKKK